MLSCSKPLFLQEPLEFVNLLVASTVAAAVVVAVERGGFSADEDRRKGLVRRRRPAAAAAHPPHVGDGDPDATYRARQRRRVKSLRLCRPCPGSKGFVMEL